MALTDRLIRSVIESDVEITRESAMAELRRVMPLVSPLSPSSVAESIVDSLVGLGPLEPLLRDPDVSDVLVNGPREVWVERRGVLARADVTFVDDAAIVAAVERTIAPLGLRFDRARPLVSARLPDGSRLHAAIPPVSIAGPIMAIRRFTGAVPDLDGFVRSGSMTSSQSELLQAAVVDRRNIVVSGPTGAGKTTLLNALANAIPVTERLVTIEDTAELQFTGHVVRLEARPSNVEGAGAVDLSELVRTALRLRPDRIIVGEVRGAEAPRFEGHQPGRDSIQGRRRCRMRRQSSMVSGHASESVSQGR